jgi:hypothetical protein
MLKVINELAKEGKIEMVVELTDFELKRRAEQKKRLRRRKKGLIKNK